MLFNAIRTERASLAMCPFMWRVVYAGFQQMFHKEPKSASQNQHLYQHSESHMQCNHTTEQNLTVLHLS